MHVGFKQLRKSILITILCELFTACELSYSIYIYTMYI